MNEATVVCVIVMGARVILPRWARHGEGQWRRDGRLGHGRGLDAVQPTADRQKKGS